MCIRFQSGEVSIGEHVSCGGDVFFRFETQYKNNEIYDERSWFQCRKCGERQNGCEEEVPSWVTTEKD